MVDRNLHAQSDSFKTRIIVGDAREEPGGRKPDAFDSLVSGAGRSGIGEGLDVRNKRSVWEVTTVGYPEAHFATFPPALVEPCVLAGCPRGGTVLDPFGGAGTTWLVADRLGRSAILIELNPDYAAMARRRIDEDRGAAVCRCRPMTADSFKALVERARAVPIAEVVGAEVALTRKARDLVGLCPFHAEKSPSFPIGRRSRT